MLQRPGHSLPLHRPWPRYYMASGAPLEGSHSKGDSQDLFVSSFISEHLRQAGVSRSWGHSWEVGTPLLLHGAQGTGRGGLLPPLLPSCTRSAVTDPRGHVAPGRARATAQPSTQGPQAQEDAQPLAREPRKQGGWAEGPRAPSLGPWFWGLEVQVGSRRLRLGHPTLTGCRLSQAQRDKDRDSPSEVQGSEATPSPKHPRALLSLSSGAHGRRGAGQRRGGVGCWRHVARGGAWRDVGQNPKSREPDASGKGHGERLALPSRARGGGQAQGSNYVPSPQWPHTHQPTRAPQPCEVTLSSPLAAQETEAQAALKPVQSTSANKLVSPGLPQNTGVFTRVPGTEPGALYH